MENLYKILQVNKYATQEEIKKSYRALVYKHHPDKNFGNENKSEEMCKSLNFAYNILKDKVKRKSYDDYGTTDGSIRLESVLEKFVEDIADLNINREQNIKETVDKGYGKNFRECSVCNGTGIVESGKGFFVITEPCKRCNGEGFIEINNNNNDDNNNNILNMFFPNNNYRMGG